MKKLFLIKIGAWVEAVTPVKFFILTAAVFGTLFILITPPFEAPDEPVHFFRAYQVSTLNLSVDKVGSTYGGELPASLQETISQTWDRPALAFHPDHKYPLSDTREAFSIKTTSKKHLSDFSTTAYYSPISYLPQALGIGAARLAKLPPIMMMYLGRLFNLAAWIVLFSLAIKLMPRRKWVVVFIALIPMALFQAASLSADVMAVGLMALLLALTLNLMAARAIISVKQTLLLILLLAGVALSKQIMFLFVPLILLLPRRIFTSRRNEYVNKAVLIAVPLVLFGLWSLHVHGIPQSNSVGGINPTGQEQFILHHPLRYLIALINVYFFSWGDGIVKSFFGNFGWVDTPLAEGIVVVGYMSLAALLLSSPGNFKTWLSARQKMFLAVLAVVYVLAVSTALYVYFTPVGFKIIVGLVGRYYLPVALLLIPVFYGNWLKLSRSAYKRIAVMSPLFLLACSAITIFVRYYINNV